MLGFVCLFAVTATAQKGKNPEAFAKEKVAFMTKYIQITPEESSKLIVVYMDYQKEANAVIDDREKLKAVIQDLPKKITAVIGEERYKTYRKKAAAVPENAKKINDNLKSIDYEIFVEKPGKSNITMGNTNRHYSISYKNLRKRDSRS